MLWKDNASGIWQIRTLEEVVEGEILEAYDEAYILWGTDVQSLPNGFSLLIDGSEGLQHVPPIEIKATGRVRPLRLIVRHYLGEQENGFNYVRCSRLVGLTTRGGQ